MQNDKKQKKNNAENCDKTKNAVDRKETGAQDEKENDCKDVYTNGDNCR